MAKAENIPADHIATMFDESVYRRTNARMFRSGFIEAFSKVHPAVPAILFVPVASYFMWKAFSLQPIWQILLAVFGGMIFWAFTEYTLHRFYFHMPQTNRVNRFLYFYSHGIHHAYPDDFYRLVMVPIVSIPLSLLFYWIFSRVLPAVWVPSSFSGFVFGYLIYDYVHFATHHVNPPRQAWLAPIAAIMKAQRRYHLKHHFDDHDTGYGVSSPLFDYVFFTVPPEKKAEKKA